MRTDPRTTGVDVSSPPPVASTDASSTDAPTPASPAGSAPPASIAASVSPLLEQLFGDDLPIRFEFWDGTGIGRTDGAGTVRLRSVDALRRILWRPDELGLGRAFVAGDLDFDGDMFEVVVALRDASNGAAVSRVDVVKAAAAMAKQLGIIQRPLPPPAEEARLSGWRHSLRRDSQAIQHHYDVGNDFYELVLGPSMTYSCARFVEPDTTLEDAQAAKYELICRKLGLHERTGARLLDVGCGWGSMAIHAAVHHGARVVGVTISPAQADRARERVAAAGVSDLVTIRIQDYRTITGETFDAISSIGMSEHVGMKHLPAYFETLRAALEPTGRLLNHAISTKGGSKIGRGSFMGRYVFPDSELIDVGDVALVMQRSGFEVRDVESLREHYAQTLRHWVANLEGNWDRAVEMVGEPRARIWRLYMAGAAVGFDDGGLAIHQVLGVATDPTGRSAMPRTRRDWG